MIFFGTNKEEKCKQLIKKANKFYEEKKFVKAVKLYQKILNLDSSHFAAKANIATSYYELEKYTDAIPYFKEIIFLDSSNPWWHNYLSQSAQKIGDFDLALNEAWTAVECDENAREHHLNLAYTIYEISDSCGRQKIDSLLQKWYQKYPQNPIAKQCYKSFFHDVDFICCESEYVEELFDVFASDFDDILAELQYDSPKIIAQNLSKFYSGKTNEKLSVLDLGCGSGLCGKEIKNTLKNAQITGVDISSNMLSKAKEKKAYKSLLKNNIITCFSLFNSDFDVVVSSDVFTYFGKLDSIFSNIYNLLCENGIFIFTFSCNFQNENDYFLMPSSRFVHSVKYVEKALSDCGFLIIKNEEKILRKEGEKNVVGRVVVAQKNTKKISAE